MISEIYNDDCLIVLQGMSDNSIDSVVTDPPYGISFMNKHWDYQVPSVEVWKEVFRVLKPGGHLLSFGGTRTYHRMVVNIEDAGFEIRDMVQWLYGSGFPKSLNIGKAVDELQGNEREIISEVFKGNNAGKKSGIMGKTVPRTDIISKGTSEYEGWGTALKPANEPICLARKPLSEKTVAQNVLKWGTGGIDIDGCRIETEDNLNGGAYSGGERPSQFMNGGLYRKEKDEFKQPQGRFPANVIHDGSEEVLEYFPNTKSGLMKQHIEGGDFTVYGKQYPRNVETIGDNGSAGRFFFKAEFGTDEYFNYLCTVNKYIESCHDQNQIQSNVNFVEKNLFLKSQVEDFVLKLVAIKDNQEGSQLKSLITPFMNEIQKMLKENCEKDTTMMLHIGQKCLQELQHTIMEILKCNLVNYVEVQKQINTMMIIQNLLNIDGFVEVVMSNTMLSNMVLGVKDSKIKYCAKASRTERNLGLDDFEKKKSGFVSNTSGQHLTRRDGNAPPPAANNHPTVKPVKLMSYLCKLITPKNGTILDPYMGSGSTGIAAKENNFNFIGIEKEESYCKIAQARIDSQKKVVLLKAQLKLF